MNIYLRSWVLTVLFLAVAGQNGSAQDRSGENLSLDTIKTQMISAAKENHALVIENKTLKAQLVALQLEVERYQQDMGESGQTGEQDGASAGPLIDWNMSEDDALIQEAQTIYLSGQSMDLDADQKLSELQLYDLQYQKQELLLDLKSKEVLYKKVGEQRKQELDSLQKDIYKNAEKEKDLYRKITEAEKGPTGYPTAIELLKVENQALRYRVENLKQAMSEQQ